jgi:hypothetical protein
MADVFISYKSERRAAAEHLAEILADYGYSVWWDYGLVSGHDFGVQIERELRQSKAVVVLWCSLAVQSEWVREEAALAKRQGKLAPTTIEKVELPLGFSLSQTIDLSEWDGAPQSNKLDRLLRDVAALVGRAPQANAEGLDRTERAWRRFGAPSLREFALIEALERKLPRTLPNALGPAPPPPPPPRGGGEPPVEVKPKPPNRTLFVALAAMAAIGVLALVAMLATRQRPAPETGPVPMATEAPVQVPTGPPVDAAAGSAPSAPAAITELSLTASANPNIVAPGGGTEIAAFVTSGNAPLADARVVVTSGGGIFPSTGTTRVIGTTDGNGVFRTQWNTNPASAYTGDMSYGIGVEASKDGLTQRGEVTIFIRMGG